MSNRAIRPPPNWFFIKRMLCRSKSRAVVLSAMESGEIFSVADIARETGMARNSVVGAIRGMQNRFVESVSLLSLGLVGEVKIEGDSRIRGYKITESGLGVLKLLKNERPKLYFSGSMSGSGSAHNAGNDAPAPFLFKK
ncbi:MAG: archaellum operon transcriptional activator EarA family protein [Candidatus Thermoplasmatota archaeon]|nr:archaellum operon transcriptional activator EarA family protein [Candidatus Thermoplasmatota archaeon]